jgi:hypothetical protein
MDKQKALRRIEGLCEFWTYARSARPSIGQEGLVMMMRANRKCLQHEATLSQAVVSVNGRFAQIGCDISLQPLVDLLEALRDIGRFGLG